MSRALPRLRPGDAVSIVTPAGPVESDRLQRGMRVLEGWGLRPRPGRHVGRRDGYLAGSDAERAADLAAAFDDPDTRAVLYARGGYGTTRLLPDLPLEALGRSGKLLVGYSDLTALSLALSRDAPFPHLYGPSVAELGDEPPTYDAESFRAALFGESSGGRLQIDGLRTVRAGRAEGFIVGGCLSLIVALTGTPFEPPLQGRLLFLEEVDEEPYRLDRMLTHLASAGRLDGVAGLLIGQLAGCRSPSDAGAGPTAEQVVASFADRSEGPVLAGLKVGHGVGRLTVPLGVRVEVDGDAGAVTFHTSR